MCLWERDREVGERGRENRKFYRSSNHEKCEGEIVGENAGEISEDNQEGGEIIWGLGLVCKRFKR